MSSSNASSSSPSPASAAGAIRPVEWRDRGSIERILRATQAFSEEETRVALELVDAACAKPDEDYIVRVLELPGAGVAGYTCHGRTPFTDGTYDLYWIAVDPAYYGTGAARRLMAEAERDVFERRGGRLIIVETASKPSYARTRRFYESMGYAQAARIRDFYRAGDDKIIYEKRKVQTEAAPAE